jgi:hypothetical protein
MDPMVIVIGIPLFLMVLRRLVLFLWRIVWGYL